MQMEAPRVGSDDDDLEEVEEEESVGEPHLFDHATLVKQWIDFANSQLKIPNESKKKDESTIPYFQKNLPEQSLFEYKTEAQTVASKEMFEAVMTFMGDFARPKEKRSEEELLNIICARPIKHPVLRNEVFCQIMKQIHEHPSTKGAYRGWVLMTLCAGCFPPTVQLQPVLKSYLMSYMGTSDKLSLMAANCYKQLKRTLRLGVRKETPTTFEVDTIKSGRPIMLSIEMPDGSKKGFFVDSASIGVEIAKDVASKIELKDYSNFGVVSVMSDDNEFCLVDDEKVMDVYARAVQYEFNMTMRIKNDAKENPKDKDAQQRLKDRMALDLSQPHFKYRKIFFPEAEDIDPSAVKQNMLLFHQMKPEFRRGNFPADINDCVRLAAYQYIGA